MIRSLLLVSVVAISLVMAGEADAALIARYRFEGDVTDAEGNNQTGDYGSWQDVGFGDFEFVGGGTPTYETVDLPYTNNNASAVALTADDDAIDLGTGAILNPSLAMTVAGWFKLLVRDDPDLDVNHFLFTRAGTWTGGPSSWASWANRPGSTVPGRFWGPGGANISQASSSEDIWDGAWHHIAITTNTTDAGGDGQTRIYIDGVESTVGDNVSSIDQVTQNTFLGSDAGGMFTNFHGFMDDVAFFDHALSAAEITQCIMLGDFSSNCPPESTVFTWNDDVAGDWNQSSKWDPSFDAPPNSPNHTAILGGNIQQARTVFTDSDVTVNRIQFDNATNSYLVGGHGTVSLAATTDPAPVNPTIDVTGTHEFQARVDLLDNATVNVASSSTLEFDNQLNLNGNTLTKTGGGTMSVNNNLTLGASGSVDCQDGTCNGTGTIAGNLDNTAGTVAPGNSPGILTVDGNYTQSAGATLALEIGGLTPGQQHDKLVVTGTADLNGTVSVELINSFSPATNDEFDDSGFWDLPDLNLVLFNWQQNEASLPTDWVNQRPATVGLESLNLVLFNWQQPSSLAVVPEPTSLAALLLGMLAVACWKWRP